MVRRNLLVISFFAFVFLLVFPTVRADWVYSRNVYNGSFTVNPLSHHYIYAYFYEGQKVHINIECTAGGNKDIDFYIFDQENYALWSSGYTAYADAIHQRIVSWSGEFQFPDSGFWYFVFSNWFSLTSTKTVQMTIDLYQWQDTFLILLIAGTVILVVVGVIAVVVFLVHQKKKAEPTTHERAQVPITRFCPHCRAMLKGDESFCGNCGSKLK
ncbi:MAG: emp24/gp25L/p24 family protein [Promethearchaeota archaeon]